MELPKALNIEFSKPYEDVEKLFNELAEMGRICVVEIKGQEYLVYVEKTERRKTEER